MLRRDFLRTTGLASTALFLPAFLRGSVTQSFSGRRVIVIQLTGGNDGLNCIVPFRDDHYYSARPSIALRNNELLRLNDDAAFNINLRGLADLFHKGEASILSSVGYPNPNRSHFRSMDIWHSASDADRYVQTGWIGRYLDALNSSNATPAHLALELDESLSLALKGEQRKGMATPDSKRLQQLLKRPLLRSLAQASLPEQGESTFLYRTLRQTVESADYLSAHTNSTHTTGNYPNHAFGKQLRQIASLIGAGVETRFFYVSLPGFDTHALQKNIQNRLLKTFDQGLSALIHDLKQQDRFYETRILVFSEFGRRVAQNGSNGTDHGAANYVFLAGGNMRRKGLINGLPDLGDLDEGDVKFKTDFRQVYATILEEWLGEDATTILGNHYPTLNIL